MKRDKICSLMIILIICFSIDFYYLNFNTFISKDQDNFNIQFASSTPVWTYDPDPDAVPRDIAISNDGNYIICGTSGNFDGDIHLFHKSSSIPLWSKDLGETIYDVDISADGSYIVAAGGDDNLYLFHRSSSTPIWNLTVGEYSFLTCAISDDGFWIAAGHYNGNLYMFNRTSSRPMWVYHYLSEVYDIDMSADGSLFVVRHGYTGLALFNRSIPNPIQGFNIVANINEFDLSEDGKWLAVNDLNDRLRLYNTSESQPVWQNSESVETVSISADGQYIVAGSSSLYFYSRYNSTPIWSYYVGLNIIRTRISADGTSIAVGTGVSGETDGVFYFNSLSSEPIWFSAAGVTFTRCMAISSNGTYITVGDGENAGVGQILLFHQDKTSPNWDTTPEHQIIEFGSDLFYDVNASDSSGIAYYWVNDTINFNITPNGLITNISSLHIGNYLLEIRAYDPDDNYCSVIINISIVDTTPPQWDQEPLDRNIEFKTHFSYDVNASDLSGITYYWINDTINFNINADGLITNASYLDARRYWVEVRAYDPFDNYCSKIISISVVDSTPPLWDTIPINQINEFRSSFSYDVDASDMSGIAYYWINDTINFNINANGLITNVSSLNIAVYWIEIRAYNPSTYFCSAVINITVVDTTPPSWDSDPTDQLLELGNSFSYDVNASDFSGIAYYWINDTINFSINGNGLIINISSLNSGEYWVELRAYDPYNNYCSAIIKIVVQLDIIPPSWVIKPIDQFIDLGCDFSYDVDAIDSSGIAYYWVNNTTNFNIDENGVITNAVSLNTGDFWIEIRAYDPYENYCSAIIKITVGSPEKSQQIPGYELIIVFNLLGITIIGFITYIWEKQKLTFKN
jgi:hypothetical protein